MYTITNKSTEEGIKVQDSKLEEKLKELFPKQNKHFYNWLKSKLTNQLYFSNNKFIIQHHLYNPDRNIQLVKTKLKEFKECPKNTQKLLKDRFYNQWFILNNETNKSCCFNNLAAICRIINVDYNFIHNGIVNYGVFNIGKYSFSRNIIPENDYCNDVLASVL